MKIDLGSKDVNKLLDNAVCTKFNPCLDLNTSTLYNYIDYKKHNYPIDWTVDNKVVSRSDMENIKNDWQSNKQDKLLEFIHRLD